MDIESGVLPIPLRGLLGDLNPAECKLHCAVWNGKEHPIDVLARSWEEWVQWSRWRGARDDFNRRYIFAMAREKKTTDSWLFGGVFEVLGRKPIAHTHSYDLELRDDIMAPYIKRLVVRFPLPARITRLNLETYLEQMSVGSVLEQPYAGEAFPGHDRIDHSFQELQVVISQNRPDWRIALEHMKGVYVIHDQVTGAPYVGAAYGDEGIWQRLCRYTKTLHGDNVALRALVQDKGTDYALQNLRFALLEFWSNRTKDQDVIDRETYWKQVLMSRTFGNNRN